MCSKMPFCVFIILAVRCFHNTCDSAIASGSSASSSKDSQVDTIHYGAKPSKEETVTVETQESSREVLETHHATCKVTTEELVATAQATVTRVLKGLCNAREMEDRFHSLELKLTEQLNAINSRLDSLVDKVSEQMTTTQKGQRRVLGTLLRNCPGVAPSADSGKPISSNEAAVDSDDPYIEALSGEEGKPLPRAVVGPRDDEVQRYNSTIHTEASPLSPAQAQSVFTYYWRVPQVTSKLAGWSPRRSLRSPSFYISAQGYRMYLRVYPRQSGETVYLHVGLTRGDHDSRLAWPFRLIHRVALLDQSAGGVATEDLLSRLWDPVSLCSAANWQRPRAGDNLECVGLGFPQHVLHERSYIREDSVIVKLTVYLE